MSVKGIIVVSEKQAAKVAKAIQRAQAQAQAAAQAAFDVGVALAELTGKTPTQATEGDEAETRPAPKKRGRKSKAEKAAEARAAKESKRGNGRSSEEFAEM